MPTVSFDNLRQILRAPRDVRQFEPALREALEHTGFTALWPGRNDLAPVNELTPEQRTLVELLCEFPGIAVGHGVPSTVRMRRRWVGLEPPSVLEKQISHTHEGRVVQWPVWRVWRNAPYESLERGQGVPKEIADQLAPSELIAAAGEVLLEPYGIKYPIETRVHDALDQHAAEALPWAQSYVALLNEIGPNPAARRATVSDNDGQTEPPYDYAHVLSHNWPALGIIALSPFAHAKEAIDPAWDWLVPYTNRTILSALSPERREAVVYHHLTTDWSPEVFNGLDNGMQVVDLAPSERVAGVLVTKLKNPLNKPFVKRSRPVYIEQLEKLAVSEPGVRAALGALKPARVRKK